MCYRPTVAQDGRDDSTLLHAWRDGDAHAGNELLRRHFVAVYRFFSANLSQAGRDVDPEDLTQRTFEACITRRDAVQTDFRAYVFGVARRLLYLEWKRRKGVGDVVSPSVAEIRDLRTSPSLAIARLDEQKLFLKALERLPAEFRAVLERFYWEERPIAEIAEELGVALGTVKSRLFRGKAMLRDELMNSKAPAALLQTAVLRLDAREIDVGPTDE